jgi:short subunit dehydrogenase-like uncharacterized protein
MQAHVVRQAGINLVELVHRSGTIAPWLYIPPVVALAMDTHQAISDKALSILKYCVAKPVRRPVWLIVLAAWCLICGRRCLLQSV